MQVTYNGEHSLLIGGLEGVHTWNDWHLIPTQRPAIAPPEVKKNTVDVPGMNGVIDMTDILLGYPTYGQRTGSIEFYVDHNAQDWDWDTAYDTILNHLHGKKTKLILTDSPSFYYEGRLSVNNWKSDKLCSTITLDYDLAPFKKMVWSTTDDWMWDPFDFQHGVLIDKTYFSAIIDSGATGPETGYFNLSNGTAGTQPMVPVIRLFVIGSINEENTKAAGGIKFVYKITNAQTGNVPDTTLDFYDAEDIRTGPASTTFSFLTPNLTIGNPDPNYIFSYKFINNAKDGDNNGLQARYSLTFTPGRL